MASYAAHTSIYKTDANVCSVVVKPLQPAQASPATVRNFIQPSISGQRHVARPTKQKLHSIASPSAPSRSLSFSSQDIILVGDIGGTNCRLNLWRTMNGEYEMLSEQKYRTVDYKMFPEALETFLKTLPPHYQPAFASLAVAGPVAKQVCKMTNCPWVIDGPALSALFNFPVAVLNDFEAVGYGITALKPSQLVSLNPNASVSTGEKGPIICMGPGTGLGVAQVIWDDKLERYRVLASEGAHGTWGPRGALQRELAAWVEAREGYCETEQVACGKGLLRIYQFLCEKDGVECKAEEPADVTWAQQQGDATAQKALDLFLDILGAEAGNKALMLLATGGVFLAGGITPKVLGEIKKGRVLEAFLYKENPKFSELLSTFPLFAVDTEELGLIGSRAYGEAALRSFVK